MEAKYEAPGMDLRRPQKQITLCVTAKDSALRRYKIW